MKTANHQYRTCVTLLREAQENLLLAKQLFSNYPYSNAIPKLLTFLMVETWARLIQYRMVLDDKNPTIDVTLNNFTSLVQAHNLTSLDDTAWNEMGQSIRSLANNSAQSGTDYILKDCLKELQ
ncbi:MAG: hypothetical protein KDD62_13340, partial [Bdellovibrionales bacterium]|nr:hypothetical protein [Bdellovibrionales bacterium]